MTTTQEFSDTVFGNEFTSRRRGIVKHSGGYTAMTSADSRDFKTLKGAIDFMARRGYDAHGRRIA
jgi:hypothetical protein